MVVCNGAQQALDLIARVLTRPGSIVAMEDPGYPPARLLFGTHGATRDGRAGGCRRHCGREDSRAPG